MLKDRIHIKDLKIKFITWFFIPKKYFLAILDNKTSVFAIVFMVVYVLLKQLYWSKLALIFCFLTLRFLAYFQFFLSILVIDVFLWFITISVIMFLLPPPTPTKDKITTAKLYFIKLLILFPNFITNKRSIDQAGFHMQTFCKKPFTP